MYNNAADYMYHKTEKKFYRYNKIVEAFLIITSPRKTKKGGISSPPFCIYQNLFFIKRRLFKFAFSSSHRLLSHYCFMSLAVLILVL